MLVEKKEINGIIICKISQKRIDMSRSREFREELLKFIAEKPHMMIVDMSEAEYFDSSALGTLVVCMRDMKAFGGQLRLACLNQTLETLMRLSKLDAMLPIFETIEKAMI